MVTPLGVSHHHGEVCKLNKTLYCLKQAPQAYFEKFTTITRSLGFHYSDHYSTLFVRTTSHGLTLLSYYMFDDMIITCDDVNEIDDLKLKLAK